MKISIKFEDGDCSEFKTVTMLGACGEADELASTFHVIVSATDFYFDTIVASMLPYTSEDNSPLLYEAVEKWLEDHKGINNE